MQATLVIPALAVFATALAAPAYAQSGRVYGPGYHDGPAYGAPAYRTRAFRDAYSYGPAIGPLFYGGGWVPEPIFDHSRTGGIDPNIRPSN
jgi:hypothetical protein